MSTLKSRPFLILIAGFLVLFIGGGARLAIGLRSTPVDGKAVVERSEEIGMQASKFVVNRTGAHQDA